MSLPATIAEVIKHSESSYRLHVHRPVRSLEGAARECEIPLEQMVRGVLLEDEHGVLLAVLPLNHSIDFSALKQLTGRDLKPVRHGKTAHYFADCEQGSVPPLAQPYRLNAVVDNALYGLPYICFEPGDRRILVCMENDAFIRLHSRSKFADFSHSLQALSSPDRLDPSGARSPVKLEQLRPLGNVADRVRHLKSLPPMPELAGQLLQIRNSGNGATDELIAYLAPNPELAAQLVRHAGALRNSNQQRIATLHEAITDHLGFEVALNLALGIAVSQPFHIASEGPLGLTSFWRHAIFSASLAEALVQLLPSQPSLTPGTAYLVGLLHNIGYLVTGELLQDEFYLLNKVVDANRDVAIPQMEKRLLGIGHTHIGSWLMRSWQMPDEVVTTVREHHNECYRGEHSHYVHLSIVVDCLLKSYGIGDGPSRSVPPASLNLLGLDLHRATEVTEQLIDQAEWLNGIANQLCA